MMEERDPGTAGMFVPSYVDGKLRDLASLTCVDIRLEDVADTLAKINRYCGRTPYPYSVAQHAVLVAELTRLLDGYETGVEYNALHHDDTEAFMGDIIYPVKRLVPDLRWLEEDYIWPAVQTKFGLSEDENVQALVKLADTWALCLEQVHVQGRIGIHMPSGCHLPEHPYERRAILGLMRQMHWRKARDQYLDYHFCWLPEVHK